MSASTVLKDTGTTRPETATLENARDGWHCPAETTLDFLSGKWRAMIIFWLMEGPLRFNELQRRLGGITHRTLSKTLKEMEAARLVERKNYGEMPPRVDYALTARGRSLKPVLQAMEDWARTQSDESVAAPRPV